MDIVRHTDCHRWKNVIYALFTEREVKMAELIEVFFGVFMDRDKFEVYKNAKRRTRLTSEQAWSMKDLSYSMKISLYQQ